MNIAVLDDYQAVAQDFADWTQLPEGSEVWFFQDHLSNEDDLVARLKEGLNEPFPTCFGSAPPTYLMNRLPWCQCHQIDDAR